jgi:hypothetical protein
MIATFSLLSSFLSLFFADFGYEVTLRVASERTILCRAFNAQSVLVGAAFVKCANVGYVFALAPISLAIMVTISAGLVDSTTTTLTLHAALMFTASKLLLVFAAIRTRFINVRHDLLPSYTIQ